MTASEFRWAGALVVLVALAIVLASQDRDVEHERAAEGAQPPVAPNRERAGEQQQRSVSTADTRLVQPKSTERVRSLADEPFVDEGTEERARARRAARLKMYADPAARALLLAEGKEGQRAYYAGLSEQLRLSPDEEDALMETLADARLRYDERRGDDSAWSYEDFQTHQEMLDTEIRNRLGAQRFRAFKRYAETRREREEVRRLRERLGEPDDLSAETAGRLVEALADERIRAESQQRQEAQPEGAMWMSALGGDVVVDPKSPSALADARKQLEEQTQRREKVAAPLLTAAQREAYEALLSERLEGFMALVESSIRAEH